MTLMGMQDYLYETQRKNLNDAWSLESNVLTFDKDVLLDTIMLDAGQLGINTTNPDQYYLQCAMWWRKWKGTFQKWWEVAETEYHWEWNTEWWEDGNTSESGSGTKDGTSHTEEVTDDDTTYNKKGNDKEVIDQDTNMTESGSDVETLDASNSGTLRAPGVTGSNSTTTTNEVSAFDSNTYQPHDTSTTTVSKSEDTTGKNDAETTTEYGKIVDGTNDQTTTRNWGENGGGTDDKTVTTDGTTGEETTMEKEGSHDIYKRGNIGVMSTQALERETFETKFHYNPYNLMSAVFVKEMTCAVW